MPRCRFPNSGISAKIFVRKISFKLRVMRLNRVELFYAFLLHFHSEGSPCKVQPGMTTASPLAGTASHLQGRGRLQPRPPCKGAVGCSQGPYAKGRSAATRPPAKGRSAATRPPAKGRPAVARASPQWGGARPRPWPRRRGYYQRSADDHPRPARKGRLTTGSAPAGRQPTGRGTARKGCRLQWRPPAAAAPAGAAPVKVPVVGVATP
ncbi:hypothetical protein BHE74_00054538 [Ensete ventricosum]|nr:hypothetical protein BHE74_00054538 [Ensete ventricosum]